MKKGLENFKIVLTVLAFVSISMSIVQNILGFFI